MNLFGKSKTFMTFIAFVTGFFFLMELSSTQNIYMLSSTFKNSENIGRTDKYISDFLLSISDYLKKAGNNLSSPHTVSANYIIPEKNTSDIAKSKSVALVQKELKNPEIIKEITPEKTISYTSGNVDVSNVVTIKNQTSYKVDTKDILSAKKPFTLPENPKVLIIHTHGTESYVPSEKYQFTYTTNSRTTDINYNVVAIGTALENELKNMGIDVIHDKSMYDYPEYNSSYDKAYYAIRNTLNKNPDIAMVIDLHRDAVNSTDGEKIKLTGSVKGEKAAQIMFVVGTDECGFKHPYWKDNLKFASMLQTNLAKIDVSLIRPINLRTSRFNQHFTKGSLIVEVGTNGNTLDEALVSAKYLAVAIRDTIAELM